jgi:quinol monooxygenase YgiN
MDATTLEAPCCAVVELRHYMLKPQQRDVLIELFEREFVESQEALGMTIIGTFRRPDAPDRFVWLRGFADMPSREAGLKGFYFGPVWKAHRETANPTMIDSDNVLLLRPARPGSGFALAGTARAPVGATTLPPGIVQATTYRLAKPAGAGFIDFFDTHIAPLARRHGAAVIATFVQETQANNFPALPVRANENAFTWFAHFDDQAAADRHEQALRESAEWQSAMQALAPYLAGPTELLRLAPTARSLLR